MNALEIYFSRVAGYLSGAFNVFKWGEITFHFEVAVRARLNLETLILILKPQSAVLLSILIL